mmetsp:Transcript_25201/g.44943  ORF Transcript_25201/g.44943 Transcript_25201/m.44943 type:complete len:209 (-) Transcript_25201:15-641(-)
MPFASAAMMSSLSLVMLVTQIPVEGTSAYGSCIFAVRDPRLPSANAFNVPHVRKPPGWDQPSASTNPFTFTLVESGSAEWTRIFSLPSLAAGSSTFSKSRQAASGPSRKSALPISCTAVTPCASKYSVALSSASLFSSSVGAGMTALTRDMAESLSRPVREPSASRSITPPGGSGVSGVSPANRSASEFTSAQCRSYRTSSTGRPIVI